MNNKSNTFGLHTKNGGCVANHQRYDSCTVFAKSGETSQSVRERSQFFHIVPRFDPPWLKDKSEMMSCVIVHGNKWAMVVATTMIALVVSAKNGSKKMKELYTVRHAIPL